MPGTFVFKPIEANLTHDTDWLGKMDPYCSFRVGSQKVKGPICKNGGKSPQWNDSITIHMDNNEPTCVVDLMDKDMLISDDNIGSFVIDLQEVQSQGQMSKWYPVYWHKKPAGEILMEIVFQPDPIQQLSMIKPVPVIQHTHLVTRPLEVITPEITTEKVLSRPLMVHQASMPSVPSEGGHNLPPSSEENLQAGASHNILEANHNLAHKDNFGDEILVDRITEIRLIGDSDLEQRNRGEGFLGESGLGQSTLEQDTLTQSIIGHPTPQDPSTFEHQTLRQDSEHGKLTESTYVHGSLEQDVASGHLGEHANFQNSSIFGQSPLNQGSLNQGSFGQDTMGQHILGQGSLGHSNIQQGSLRQDNLQGSFGQGIIGQGSLRQDRLGEGPLESQIGRQSNLQSQSRPLNQGFLGQQSGL